MVRARAATMRDVAVAAGVSPKTVSNVVNGYVHVREDTRRRVAEQVALLGYRPHAVGRQLRRGRTGVVALVVPGIDMPYFADLAAQLVRAARGRGLVVAVEQTDGVLEREREVLAGGPVHFADGLVFSPLELSPDELAAAAVEPTTATVIIGEHDGPLMVDWVATDSHSIAEAATRHVLGLGRRRVAFLGAKARDHVTGSVRLAGYRAALSAGGVPPAANLLATVRRWTRDEGDSATAALLERVPDLDAIVAGNDILALGALRALRRAGRRVPEDVAVVGVDDLPESAFAQPALTTVAIDRGVVAEEVLAMLASRWEDPDLPPRSVVVPHRLVVRDSA